jgi:hypothetical protein
MSSFPHFLSISLLPTRLPSLYFSLLLSISLSSQQQADCPAVSLRSWLKADSHIPCCSHAVPMPFPCCSHAVPLPCHEYAFLKATSQGHGRVAPGWRRETACWRLASVRLIPATTPSSIQFVISSIQISDAVTSVKQSGVCDGRGEDYCVGARTWVLV